jgi:predicted ATP-dependent protease
MTGEITLAGLVLPVGGVKEKVLAAKRAGIKRVVLPLVNQKDLQDLPENIEKSVEFVFVENIRQALKATLPRTAPKPSSRTTKKTIAKAKAKKTTKATPKKPKKTASKKSGSHKAIKRKASGRRTGASSNRKSRPSR